MSNGKPPQAGQSVGRRRAAPSTLAATAQQEARLAARLRHPNIVPIHTIGQRGELRYFVMGFVDGKTLGDRLGRDGVDATEAEGIFRLDGKDE